MKHTKIKYDLKLNIKSLILYEKLTQESFAKFDGSFEKIIPLLYCMLVANNDYKETYEDTIKYLFNNENLMKDLSSKLDKEMKFNYQFKSVIKQDEINLTDKTDNKEIKQVFISQMIPILVNDCGLDINYVMNELNYTDIDMYIQYKDDKEKNRLEEKRLFTYLTVLPHIDSKKCNLKQFFEFPWEVEERKNKSIKEMNENQHKLHEFLNSKNKTDEIQ